MGNAAENFFVELVFHEWEFKSYDNGQHRDGQAGHIGGLAATRELSAGTFRYFHDAVDSGISFLLFVDTTCVGLCDDGSCGAFPASAGLKALTTEFTESTEAENPGRS